MAAEPVLVDGAILTVTCAGTIEYASGYDMTVALVGNLVNLVSVNKAAVGETEIGALEEAGLAYTFASFLDPGEGTFADFVTTAGTSTVLKDGTVGEFAIYEGASGTANFNVDSPAKLTASPFTPDAVLVKPSTWVVKSTGQAADDLQGDG